MAEPGSAGTAQAPTVTVTVGAAMPGPATEIADPWGPLLDAGLQWLAALASPPQPDGVDGSALRITTDPATRERSLKVPLPDPATVQRLADGVMGLLARLNR